MEFADDKIEFIYNNRDVPLKLIAVDAGVIEYQGKGTKKFTAYIQTYGDADEVYASDGYTLEDYFGFLEMDEEDISQMRLDHFDHKIKY